MHIEYIETKLSVTTGSLYKSNKYSRRRSNVSGVARFWFFPNLIKFAKS